MSNPMCQRPCLLIKIKHQILRAFFFQNNSMGIYLWLAVFLALTGCAHLTNQKTAAGLNPHPKPKIFVVILDALQRKTLMESLDSLPNFKEIIKGRQNDYPYIYFENVLVSIPSSSKPSNTTLLTGVYPDKHGVPSTIWFDRKDQKIKTLNSITQRRITYILQETKTDTIFDYARRAARTTMAVATQVAKGVDSRDWIQQSVHLWGQAFCLNLLQDFNPIPDGAHLDRGTTAGLLKGYMYSVTDGLEGKLRTSGDIPDLTVVHFVGMDIFTHYPRRFMLQENWSLKEIQKWYLQKILDPELGKIKAFLTKHQLYDNTIFFFASDHGQSRIRKHIDEKNFEKRISNYFKVMGRSYSMDQAEIIVMPGAGTKTLYVKNRLNSDWMTPPRLLADVKPVVDTLIDTKPMSAHLNALLVAQYPGERDEFPTKTGKSGEIDPFWLFNLSYYRQSDRQNHDFLEALEPLSKLDALVGNNLKAAYMYRHDFVRQNIPDIILINQPGYFFTPDRGKYTHHGSIYADSALVSFMVSGPAIHRFSDAPQIIARQIDTVDLVPMVAHLAGIKIDRPVDGINRLLEEQ
jgi:predicted AlkP superfamily pyrophosphatase or phosphodiesterase